MNKVYAIIEKEKSYLLDQNNDPIIITKGIWMDWFFNDKDLAEQVRTSLDIHTGSWALFEVRELKKYKNI